MNFQIQLLDTEMTEKICDKESSKMMLKLRATEKIASWHMFITLSSFGSL